MPRTSSARLYSAFVAVAFAATALLTGCSGGGAPSPSSTAKDVDEAFELNRPVDCAVKGGPWELDHDAILGAIIEYLSAQGANITGGEVSGNYTIEFTGDGHFRIATDGILVRTSWITGEGESLFYDETAAGTGSASWVTADEGDTQVIFDGWESDLVPDLNFRPQLRDDMTGAAGIEYPIWDLSYNTSPHEVLCDGTQLTIRLASGSGIPLVFTN